MIDPNPDPRPEKIMEMVDAMTASFSADDDFTATEVFSAAMTFALRTIKVVIGMGASPDKVRAAVEQLLVACEALPITIH
jgi:hypothetical protein